MEKRLTVALVAHDNMKHDLAEWVAWNWEKLLSHRLVCTGTTGRIVAETLMERRSKDAANSRFDITMLKSGPLGGDQQIGAKIVEGRIDLVIFFSDPLTAQPHDPDVKALLRIAQVYDIPIANNRATADFILQSKLMNEEYEHTVINFSKNIQTRAKELK